MKKLIITFLIISALGALAGCSNTDSSISVTTPDTTSVTTTTTTASATSQSEETTTTTTTSDTETQMPTETSQTEGETSSNTESVSSVQESSSATTTTTDETEATKPAVTTTSTQGTTSKVTTTTKKQTTTTKATTTKPAETTQSKVTTTTQTDPWVGEYKYIKSETPLYSKPNETSSLVCMLAGNTKVYLEAGDGNWYKVVSDKKKLKGYVKSYTVRSSPSGDINTIEDMSLYDDECFRLLNEHRKELGLSELKYSSDIQKAADIRAEEISEVFDHVRPNGEKYYTVFDELGIDYSKGKTEIICTGANLPQDAFDAWLESPGHYQHMISEKYTAAACGRYNGQWVIMFITE